MKRAREPLFLHQNEGMTSQQLGDIQAQREKDAKQKAAADAWIKGAPARLEKEREARRNSPTGKQAQARIDQMQAEVANLERNLSKGSLSDKNAKLKRIRELKGQIASTVIR
jgi:anti-sigma28 factor (negative regulator of flagellin synthesis)